MPIFAQINALLQKLPSQTILAKTREKITFLQDAPWQVLLGSSLLLAGQILKLTLHYIHETGRLD